LTQLDYFASDLCIGIDYDPDGHGVWETGGAGLNVNEHILLSLSGPFLKQRGSSGSASSTANSGQQSIHWTTLCELLNTFPVTIVDIFCPQSDGRRWAEAYLPYLLIFTTGYWTQLSLYWILGTFSSDIKSSSRTGRLFRAFETAGQAVSYAISSHTGSDTRIPFYVNCAILVLAIPSMILLIRMIPEVPASTDVDVNDTPVIVGLAKTDQWQTV
jgi:hypothetical protein